MPAKKGASWNESETYRDRWTLRPCRRLTTLGEINQSPNYHTNIGFTADSEYLVFWTKREDKGAFCKVRVATGEITQLTEATADYGFDYHIQGGPYPRMCLAPRSGWLVYTQARSLRAVHLDTLEERVLLDHIEGEIGYPSVSCDESHVILPVSPYHPEVAAGERVTKSYFEHFPTGTDMVLRLLQVPLTGGKVEIAYEEQGCRSFHSPHSPVDSDLLLLDRDFPPHYWGGSDGKTTRIWTLDLSTGQLTELPSQDGGNFQVHCAWTFDGEAVVYHGRSLKGGAFIGVCDKQGNTLQEYGFYDAKNYGHVAAMAGRPAIILDGDLSPDLLMWVYYDRSQPRVEVIAHHGTAWGTLPGQATHPHPLCSPDGRWISWNAAQRGRSDMFVVQV